jgi:hypothetical protein
MAIKIEVTIAQAFFLSKFFLAAEGCISVWVTVGVFCLTV